jgi:hypothetical protein
LHYQCPSFAQFNAIAFYFISGLQHAISPTSAINIATGRALAGIGHGLIYITTIIYAGEIAVKHARGRILATLHVSTFLGMLIYSLYTVNSNPKTSLLDPNQITGIITLVCTAIAGICGYFLTHDSPVHLIQKDGDAEAKRVMMKLRNETEETTSLNEDFMELKTMVSEDQLLSSSIFSDGNIRPLLIMTVLRVFGVIVFNFPLNFVRAVFAIPHTGEYTSVLISGIRTASGLISLILLDRAPRFQLFFISSVPASMSLLIAAVTYAAGLLDIGDDATLVSVVLFDFMSGLAIIQLVGIFSAEAFPTTKKVNSLVVTIAVEYILHILLILLMMNTSYERGTILTIQFTCLVVMIMSVIFLILKLPATLKQSLRQTRDLFKGLVVVTEEQSP